MMRNFGVSNAANSNLSDPRAHNGFFNGSDRKFFLKGISISEGWPPSWLPYHLFHTFFLMFFILFVSFFLLLTHSALFTLCLSISFFLYGIVTGKSSLEAQLLKPSLEASTSVSPLRGISICKSSLWGNSIWSPLRRHMGCKSSSRHQFLTQAAINVAEIEVLAQ